MKGDNARTNIVVKKDTTITSHMKDYTGYVINNDWIILSPVGRNCNNRMLWEFECLHCGNKYIRSPSNVKLCTCDCQINHREHYTMSFYDWCKQNNHDEWIELWDYELNDYDIHNVGYSSDMQYFFKCNNHDDKHHSELYRLSNLTNGCQKGILCKQCNSFAQTGINIMGENFLDVYWDYEKNTVSPWDISRGSDKKVWIKCPNGKHESHRITARDGERHEYGCPNCINELKVSKLHKKCIDYINSLNLKINTEYDCSIIPINPQTNCKMPYDIEVVEYKLIIEVMGFQHYEEFKQNHPWLKGETPKNYLEKRKKYDKYKKDYALMNGYYYLEIPYTYENDEKYKVLIDKKIDEIKLISYIA